MTGKRNWARGGPLLLLLSSCVGVPACQRSQPPPGGPSSEATTPYSTPFSARGWTYHLRRFKSDATADEAKAKEVWRDLLTGMAKDPRTRDLLRRLHADLPVEVVVLDAKQAEDKAVLMAPPPDGAAVAMRVADISHKEEKSKAVTVPVRVIAYSRVILIRDAASADPDLGALAEQWSKEPLPGGPLSLAMDDYVLRHIPGWTVIGG